MAEPEAAYRPGVVRLVELFVLFELVFLTLLVVLGVLDGVAIPVAVPVLRLVLVACDQLREHPRERVDLMPPELGSRRQARRMVGQLPLEAEHERVSDLPGGRRRAPAGLHFRQGVVERATARAALRQRLGRVFVRPEEWLARPLFSALGGGGQAVRFPRKGPLVYRFV